MTQVDESPLANIVRDEHANHIIEQIRQAVSAHAPIIIEPSDVQYIRKVFAKSIRDGEQKLHQFSRGVISRFNLLEPIESKLMVFGRCTKQGHEGLLRNDTEFEYKNAEFLSHTDGYLARLYAPLCSLCGEQTQSIASFVQYKVKNHMDSSGILFFRTRIKSSSHIAYKLADIAFNIDQMFKRDKIHNHLSQSITDIYGMKIIVKQDGDVMVIADQLISINSLALIEKKDYTGEKRKKSGFEAYKLVTNYNEQIVEIQIQSKRMFDTERQSYTANHQTYKELQQEQRKKLGKEYTAVRESLLKLLLDPEDNSPEYLEFGLFGKGLDDEF